MRTTAACASAPCPRAAGAWATTRTAPTSVWQTPGARAVPVTVCSPARCATPRAPSTSLMETSCWRPPSTVATPVSRPTNRASWSIGRSTAAATWHLMWWFKTPATARPRPGATGRSPASRRFPVTTSCSAVRAKASRWRWRPTRSLLPSRSRVGCVATAGVARMRSSPTRGRPRSGTTCSTPAGTRTWRPARTTPATPQPRPTPCSARAGAAVRGRPSPASSTWARQLPPTPARAPRVPRGTGP